MEGRGGEREIKEGRKEAMKEEALEVERVIEQENEKARKGE